VSIAKQVLSQNPQQALHSQTAYRQGKAFGVGSFAAYKGVAQENIPSEAITAVTFDTEEFDVSNWYDTSTSLYTPKQKGFYRISCQVAIYPSVADKRVCWSCTRTVGRIDVLQGRILP